MNFNINKQQQMLEKINSANKSEGSSDRKTDIELNLEVDKLNDIKNLMYLKGKVMINGMYLHHLIYIYKIIDARHKLSKRSDFK